MLHVYFSNLTFFQVLKSLKFASFAIAFSINVTASDNKPSMSEDSQPTKRYSCLTERYHDFGALLSDQCKESSRPYWLLSLDGGGVRAFMHLLSIDRIENITNTPISELVDGISGTSAGGLLACLLTMKDHRTMRPKYLAKDLIDAMIPTRDKMFTKRWSSLWGLLGPRYRSKPLERYLGNFLGDDKFQSRSVPVVLVAHDLSSYSERLIASTDSANYFTLDVIMAALSAPTFLPLRVIRSINVPSAKHLLMDGATVMDNPVLAGVSLLQESYGVHLKDLCVTIS